MHSNDDFGLIRSRIMTTKLTLNILLQHRNSMVSISLRTVLGVPLSRPHIIAGKAIILQSLPFVSTLMSITYHVFSIIYKTVPPNATCLVISRVNFQLRSILALKKTNLEQDQFRTSQLYYLDG